MEKEKKKINFKIIIPIIVIIAVIVGIVIFTRNPYNYLTSVEWKALNGTTILKFNNDKTGMTNTTSFNWQEENGIITIKFEAGIMIHLKYEEENGIKKLCDLQDTGISTDYTCISSNNFDVSRKQIIDNAPLLNIKDVFNQFVNNSAKANQEYGGQGKYYKITATVRSINTRFCKISERPQTNLICVYLSPQELATLNIGDKITVVGCIRGSIGFDLYGATLVK